MGEKRRKADAADGGSSSKKKKHRSADTPAAATPDAAKVAAKEAAAPAAVADVPVVPVLSPIASRTFFLLLLQGGAWGGGGIGGEWGVSVFPAWARQEWSGVRRAWATLAGCGGRFHAPFCLGLVALRGMLRRVLPRMAVPSWVSVSCAALVWCGLSSPEATQLARCDPAGTSAPCAELCGGSPRGHGS